MIILSFFLAGVLYTFATYGVYKLIEPKRNNVIIVINENNTEDKPNLGDKSKKEDKNLIDL